MIRYIIASTLTAIIGIVLLSVPITAVKVNDCPAGVDCALLKENDLQQNHTNNTMVDILNLALVALGGVCVIVIVAAGLRMVISRGEAASIQKSKMMILYALIGLGVAALSGVIVNFVVTFVNNG